MIGCLCLHGFTGSPYEVEPLVTFLKENTNWIVVSPTFPGHDTKDGRMERVTYQEWIHTAEMELRALQEKCNKIYVVGFSMGGIIAGYLAASNQIDRLVLLSAAAHYVSPSRLVQDIKSMLQDLFKGNLYENEMFQRYLRKFKGTPLSMTFQFRSLIRSLRPYLKKIITPTLIIQGECDGVVPKKSAHYIYNTIRSKNKEIILLPQSKHIVCHDVEQEDVIRHVYRFLTDTEIDEAKGEVTS
ncbi:alpha/beta hydrolase [Pseudalkalibacillus sp. A8]|uniref:alpha/beta hydrolase n=1 Tax=Pseudalkalibacillus sp. A8 TaxID=3382641 RepID=UPI0038B6A887